MLDIIPILVESLEEEYSKPREGVHVSDITLCPRKSCYQKIDPTPLDMKSLNFFSSGRAIHESLSVLATRYPDRFERDKEVIRRFRFATDVIGTMDLYDKKWGVPIEAKSMRMKDVKVPKPHHLTQLKAYMALSDSENGILLYQLLLHFDDTPWREFHITMNKTEREKTLTQLEQDALDFKAGLSGVLLPKHPELVRHIAYDPDFNWLCRSCPYEADCIKLRIQEKKKK